MSVRIFSSGTRLKAILILIALFVGCGFSLVYGREKDQPELGIKKISNLGTGVEKVDIPGAGRTVYVLGSSKEKVFAVKIKNNTRKEKHDVSVKLSLYDKEGKLMGKKSPCNLKSVYADDGYLIGEGTLYPRKTVKLYFVANKKVKYVKAELFCKGKLMDVKTHPSSFLKKLSEKK